MTNERRANGSNKKPPAFYIMLVVVSFCLWFATWAVLCRVGQTHAAAFLAVGNIFNMTGWVGALAMAVARIWGLNDDDFPIELLLPLLMIAVRDWEGLVYYFQTPSADEMLFSFDKIFGYPEFFLGRIFLAVPLVLVLAKVVYFILLIPVVVVHLALPDRRLRWRLWTSVALMGLFGVIFYYFCPAAGPIYVFHEYPRIPAVDAPVVKFIPNLIPNCTPSVHLAMALLVLLYSRLCGRAWQVLGWVFLGLTVLVTLGLGEHYVIDLVLGVPFAGAIDGLADRKRRRKAYACFLLVLVWEVALCHGLALYLPAPVAFLLSCLTVAAPFAGPLYHGKPRLAVISQVDERAAL
jgi:PAP2 superfamily